MRIASCILSFFALCGLLKGAHEVPSILKACAQGSIDEVAQALRSQPEGRIDQAWKVQGEVIKNQRHEETSWAPLLYAALHGQAEVVRWLAEQGADLEAQGVDGRRAVHWAASQGHAAVMRVLIEQGADLEALDENEQSAFELVIDVKTKALLEAGLSKSGAPQGERDNQRKMIMGLAGLLCLTAGFLYAFPSPAQDEDQTPEDRLG